MTDDKKDYTTEDLEWIDQAMLHIGGTVAAEVIRRSPSGVAATTREIVEALAKERRAMRELASSPAPSDTDPIAKDSTLEYYRGTAEHYDKLRGTLAALGIPVGHHDDVRKAIEAKDTRIAELTKQRDDEMGLARFRSFEIDTWKKELAEARGKIADLERQLAIQAPKVKEWRDAIDALSEAWPKDVPYAKDNPTHAEWIRDLVAVLGEKAKTQTADSLGRVRVAAKDERSSFGVVVACIDEELAALGDIK